MNMHLVMSWLSFLGSWLLFAGPIYQAALELQDENIEHDRLRAVKKQIEAPAPISAWWWLVPPAKIILERRRDREFRQRYASALSGEDVEALISFMNKSMAWLLVATSGLCLAINETYQLTTEEHWSNAVLAELVVVLALTSILYTVSRISRSTRIVKKYR